MSVGLSSLLAVFVHPHLCLDCHSVSIFNIVCVLCECPRMTATGFKAYYPTKHATISSMGLWCTSVDLHQHHHQMLCECVKRCEL